MDLGSGSGLDWRGKIKRGRKDRREGVNRVKRGPGFTTQPRMETNECVKYKKVTGLSFKQKKSEGTEKKLRNEGSLMGRLLGNLEL